MHPLRSACSLLLALLTLCAPLRAVGDPDALRLLILYDQFPPDNAHAVALDPTLKARLGAEGIVARTALYSEITADMLAAFHVVLVMQEPAYGQSFLIEKNQDAYRAAGPLLLDFARRGGGLFITHDANFNPQEQDCRLLNEVLLAPLDAELIPETVVDPRAHVLHKERFTTMTYLRTENIAPHPVTAGVKSLLVPIGPESRVRDNVPIRTGAEWRVLVRGNATAFSGGDGGENAPVTKPVSYRSEPPLVAIRTFGEGRVFLFPQPARVWFHSAYHRELGGFVYREGDGYKLIIQALRHLAEPSLMRRHPIGLPPEKASSSADLKTHKMSQASVDALLKRTAPDSAFMGVVGLESSKGSVGAFARAAQEAGLSFIAFADDAGESDAEKYAKLVEECRAVSSDAFLALPGIRYTSDAGLQFLALSLPHLPGRETFNWHPLGSHDVRALNNRMPYAPIHGHKSGGFPPWALRFWDAVDVVACVNGQVYDDSIDWYREVAANMQEVIPLASQRVESPAVLKRQTPWKTGVIAPRLKDVENLLRQGNQKTFVTEGPRIQQFSILNRDHAPLGARWYSTAFWKAGDRVALNIHVTSDAPLRAVTLYWGKEVFRRFHPKSGELKEVVWFSPAKDASFRLEAEDEAGRRAFSSPILLRGFFKRFNWCTDQQNLICWNYSPDEDPRGTISPGKYGYHVSLNPGRGDVLEPNLPAHEVFDAPPGREINMGGLAPKFSRIMAWPKFHGAEPTDEVLYQNRLVFCSEDAHVLDLEWNKDSRNPLTPEGPRMFEWKARFINPRGKPHEPNFWLIETSVKVLRDIRLGERQGPEIVLLDGISPASLAREWPRFVIAGKDGKVRGDISFADPLKPVLAGEVPLRAGGYIALPSNRWFTPAFYPLDGGEYTAHVGNSKEVLGLAESPANGVNIQIGRNLPKGTVPAGTVWKCRFLYVAASGEDTGEEFLDRLGAAYGLSGGAGPRVEVRQGRRLPGSFDVQVEAAGHRAVVAIAQAELPSCLVIQVRRLNPNWEAVILDVKSRSWRKMGIYETTGLTTHRCDSARELFLGHPYVCDDPEIRLALRESKDGLGLEVHNPRPHEVEVVVSSQKESTTVFPKLHRRIALAAGETRLVSTNE